jgi:hypothetical protein
MHSQLDGIVLFPAKIRNRTKHSPAEFFPSYPEFLGVFAGQIFPPRYVGAAGPRTSYFPLKSEFRPFLVSIAVGSLAGGFAVLKALLSPISIEL